MDHEEWFQLNNMNENMKELVSLFRSMHAMMWENLPEEKRKKLEKEVQK